jgi:hypothetical protein
MSFVAAKPRWGSWPSAISPGRARHCVRAAECENLKSQIVTSSLESAQEEGVAPDSSQFAMSSKTELVTICDQFPKRMWQASRSQIVTLNNFSNHRQIRRRRPTPISNLAIKHLRKLPRSLR